MRLGYPFEHPDRNSNGLLREHISIAIRQLLALVTGAYSFMAVYLMCGFLTMLPAFVTMQLTNSFSVRTLWRWEGVIAFALSCIIAFYASFPVARFINRIFPVPANGTRRAGLLLACAFSLGFLAFLFTDQRLLQEVFTISVPWLIVLNTAVVVWIFLWQSRGVHTLDKPFILFLRRFSSFSDRAVLGALLGGRPDNCRMAFLAPVAESPANFSPVVVAFSGTRFRHPLRGSPLLLRARNIEWEDRIEDLIRAAACVVIDPSSPSPGIDKEIEIVLAQKSPEQVLWLADARTTGRHLPDEVDPKHLMQYRRSWAAAAPRIVLELLALAGVGLLMGFSLKSDPQISSSFAPWMAWGIGVLFFALGVPVILQPSLSRADKKYIKKALGAKVLDNSGYPSGHSATPLEREPKLCAILRPAAAFNQKTTQLLERAAGDRGLHPVWIPALNSSDRALRDAVRLIDAAELLLADVTEPDTDVQYLLGVANGLGREILLFSEREGRAVCNVDVQWLASDSKEADRQLADAFNKSLRKTPPRGPVAGLLADRLVCGEALPWRRLLAFFLDLALCVGMIIAYRIWHDWPLAQGPLGVIKSKSVMDFIGITVVVLIVYRFVLLAFFGTTVGMRFVSLRLITTEGEFPGPMQAFGRSMAFFLQFCPFMDYLFCLYRPRYQSLEDVLSGTQVVLQRSMRAQPDA